MTDGQVLTIVQAIEALRLAVRATETETSPAYLVKEDPDNEGFFNSVFNDTLSDPRFERSDSLASIVLARAKTRNAGH